MSETKSEIKTQATIHKKAEFCKMTYTLLKENHIENTFNWHNTLKNISDHIQKRNWGRINTNEFFNWAQPCSSNQRDPLPTLTEINKYFNVFLEYNEDINYIYECKEYRNIKLPDDVEYDGFS